MRLLYLSFDRGIPVLGDKGASVHVREFVRAACELGHEVLLACAKRGSGNRAPPGELLELPCDGLEQTMPALGASEGSDPTLLQRELTKVAYDQRIGERVLSEVAARGWRPELVYERHALFCTAGVGIAAQLSCPRILEVNAPLVEEQKRFRGLCLQSQARRMEIESFRGADAIVAVSQQVSAYIQASCAVGARRIHVLPNAVDVAAFGSGQGRDEVRRQLGYGPADCAVTFIGSFKPWHGTAFLLEVFEALARMRPCARLIAVGDGPEREGVAARAARSPFRDRVCLPGRIPHAQIPSWVAAGDIVVAPYEAMEDFYFSPLKVVEALAAGKPVVAPRLGQLAEMVEHGRTGLLYPPGDAAACREAIRSLMDDPARRECMGRAARSAVAGQSWQHNVRRVLEIARSAPARQVA